MFASRLMQQWPIEMRCVPGNHDLGDGSGEVPRDDRLLEAYGDIFGPMRHLWMPSTAFILPDDMQTRIGESASACSVRQQLGVRGL